VMSLNAIKSTRIYALHAIKASSIDSHTIATAYASLLACGLPFCRSLNCKFILFILTIKILVILQENIIHKQSPIAEKALNSQSENFAS
jgi:hypothetical protein